MVADMALEFGRSVLRQDGSLDRQKLARMVFGDPDAVARLNAIAHPPIGAEVERRIASLVRDDSAGVVCVVAPLLLEAGLGDTVDRLLVMTADGGTRVRRVMARDGVSEDEVRARMAAQMPPGEQVERADWVVDATGEREEALRQLDAIWAELNE
jgi:dephospho-CoA kinase